MKLITRNTDYAIRAICSIAESKEKKMFSVSELAKELKIPRPFLRKILQILDKKKILNSHKGRGGGFNLAVSPDKIFLVDLMEIFQGPLKLNDCLFSKDICPDVFTCRLRKKINSLQRYVVKELKTITIGSLLR